MALSPPDSVLDALECNNGTVAEFIEKYKDDPNGFEEALQDVLLSPLNVYAGKYSNFHLLAARSLVSTYLAL